MSDSYYMYTSVEIANQFVERNPQGLSLMQLLKLSYIAHGFHLGLFKMPLANEYVQAWRYGPVFPSIYDSFKYQDVYKIVKPIKFKKNWQFSTSGIEIIKFVQDNYANMEGWQLSALTHAKDTPWFKAWQEVKTQGYIKGYIIRNEDIQKYYERFIEK